MTGIYINGIMWVLARSAWQQEGGEKRMDVFWDFFVSVLGSLAANYLLSFVDDLADCLKQRKKGK